ncbi:MAG: cobalt-precorrin-6A reductase [Gammaproteobacteria bacterium]|nr:MAG: cobalt-precorrin-6A reductase [Pseudomonadota bacterium]PIE38047.1 MAG: cobalt-precorrin-6A reductase [Gammaproteobacteria bacterium]
MNILLLGGTSDARAFVRLAWSRGLFDGQQHSLIYSVAGLVRAPDVPCQVISGGFSQFGGLAAWLESAGIHLVFDMTHPYAKKMSLTAMRVCQATGVAYWRFVRQPWVAEPGDHWVQVSSWPGVVDHCAGFTRVLLTVGQLAEDEIAQLSEVVLVKNGGQIIVRTAAPLRARLPESSQCQNNNRANIKWIKAIGPFDLGSERKLLDTCRVDCLVSKNSGGDATRAKLIAAREAGIPVIMLERPVLPPVETVFHSLEKCLDQLSLLLSQADTPGQDRADRKTGTNHVL